MNANNDSIVKKARVSATVKTGRGKYTARFVYNSKCKPKDIESQMVHPLGHSFMLYRMILNNCQTGQMSLW